MYTKKVFVSRVSANDVADLMRDYPWIAERVAEIIPVVTVEEAFERAVRDFNTRAYRYEYVADRDLMKTPKDSTEAPDMMRHYYVEKGNGWEFYLQIAGD